MWATFLLDVADVPEPRLLECAPGRAVLLVDRGHAGVDCDEVAQERPQDLRPEPSTGQIDLADQQIDACHARTDLHDRLPLRIVGDEIGLDHPGVAAVDDDHVVVGRFVAAQRRRVVGDRLVERLRVAPPAVDVRALQPVVQLPQIVLAKRPERDQRSPSQ